MNSKIINGSHMAAINLIILRISFSPQLWVIFQPKESGVDLAYRFKLRRPVFF
jgi:hypothetical protein